MMASLSSTDPQPSAAGITTVAGAGNPDLILDCLDMERLDIALVSSPSATTVAGACGTDLISARLYHFCSSAVALFSEILLWEPFILRGFLCSGAFAAIRCTCFAVSARLYINKSQIWDDLKWQEQVHICRAELRAQTAQWHAEGRVEPTYFPFESDSDDD
jgi:hypothetical protein